MKRFLLPFLLLALASGCDSCNDTEGDEAAESTETEPTPPPVEPIEAPEVNMDKVYLGRRLYHDPILSGDGTVSCATCHTLDHGGAEDRRTSNGIGDQVGPINSPTVLNAHFNFVQFWDGRAENLQEQAAGPIENPIEMGGAFGDVVGAVAGDEWYAERFASIYGEDDPVTKDNITDALAEYERYLITPAPFDDFLRGDESALNEQEQRGWAAFQEVGCISCHQGVNLGGTMFQKMGVVENYFEMRGGELTEADHGRFNVTEDEADRHKFKVPTLRNITLTPPYFHDGSQTDLREVVRIMARIQLGKQLEDGQVDDIVAFLGALEGELPAEARLPEDQAPPDRRATGGEGLEHPETGEEAEEVLETADGE
ncbi:MAG: cytochrome B6 [Sandaracinus sp.]|nr:cytochrome B6 [Sandaracinus sp.]